MPFGFVYTTLSYYLRSRGVPLEQIGILSLLGLAWSLKVLWSPLADRFGSRAAWLVPAQVGVILSMLSLAWLADGPVGPGLLGFGGGPLSGFGHPGPGSGRLRSRPPGHPS